MKVTNHGDSLYEEHGATLKHKCEEKNERKREKGQYPINTLVLQSSTMFFI
jgi:hypothetical protein